MKSLLHFTGILFLVIMQVSCEKDNSCEDCPPDNPNNQAPVARAGTDQSVQLPKDSAQLDGSASTDADGRITGYQWSRLSGPASFQLVHADASRTMVHLLEAGVYRFELTVKDDQGATARDTVQVTVHSGPVVNQPPVARAGDDQTISLPTNATGLDGTASSDPDGAIASWQWTKIAGPSSLALLNSNAAQAQVTGLVEGVYQFELTVTDDGGLQAKDTMQVTVDAHPDPSACNNSNRPKVNARLVPFGSLSKPKVGVVIAAAGNKIVFAGGQSGGQPCTNTWCEEWGSARVDIYDVATQSWSTAELSQPRFGIAAVAAGNKIFFAGGESGDGAHNLSYASVDIYDVTTNTWSVALLSEPRSYVEAATVGSKVFFAGGEISDNHTSSRVDIYDLATDKWSTAQLSEARASISALTIGNKIYFAGGWVTGYSGDGSSNRIDIWNDETGTWSTSTLNTVQGFLGGIALDGKAYWAHGCGVEVRDVTTGNSRVDNLFSEGLWIKNDGNVPVVKDNKIVFYRHYLNSFNRFDLYDPATNTWSVGTLPEDVTYSSIISVNNTIYLAGGFVNYTGYYNPSNKVWKLEF